MAALEALLSRFTAQPRIGDDALLLEAFSKQPGPSLEKAWYSWAEAQRAVNQGDPRLALAWLAVGRDLAAEVGDRILAAERASTELQCWLALDEPTSAANPAQTAWGLWSSFAAKPSSEQVVESARALLAVLSAPHRAPRLDADEIFIAWLEDRFPRGFIGAAQQFMRVCGDYRDLESAAQAAATFLDWVERYVSGGPSGSLGGLVAARLMLALGDVHDRCGDSAGALTVFQDALKRIDGLPELQEVTAVRGHLRFDAANQLAKLGRHQEALEEFAAVNSILQDLGDREAVLRGRYAVCVARFKLGQRAELENELSELAIEYERIVAEAPMGLRLVAARQGLDRVYRLWLRLIAEHYDGVSAGNVVLLLHLAFALKEEDGKFAEIWQVARANPNRALLSEISIMLDRSGQHAGLGILVIEQVVDALLFVSVRPGAAPWNQRVAVELMDDREGISAVTGLILVQGRATERLCGYDMPLHSAPDTRFVAACCAAWDALGERIREHITESQMLMVCLDSQTEFCSFPLELLHDGSNYLGLSKDILRVPSLRDLNLLLGDNRTNASATGSAIVLRAEDDLEKAEAEVRVVEDGMRQLHVTPHLRTAPAAVALLTELGAGVDLLHYVGHGLANAMGEELPLGPDKRLAAMDLETLYPAPAPVTILSACLVGRTRQLRTGHEQGFATQLLRRGSPAVIAATYRVPNGLTAQVFEFLYEFMSDATVPAALRMMREALAQDGYHPAAWASFVVFGRPGVCATKPHASEALSWPSAALRYLATGAEAYLHDAQLLLERDVKLTPTCRRHVARDLAKLAAGDSAYFQPEVVSQIRGLEDFPEANLAHRLINTFGLIRHGATPDPDERERRINVGIAEALAASRILGDTYVLIAAAAEMCSRTFHHLGEHRNTALQARRRLSWISREGTRLDSVRTSLDGEEV